MSSKKIKFFVIINGALTVNAHDANNSCHAGKQQFVAGTVYQRTNIFAFFGSFAVQKRIVTVVNCVGSSYAFPGPTVMLPHRAIVGTRCGTGGGISML